VNTERGLNIARTHHNDSSTEKIGRIKVPPHIGGKQVRPRLLAPRPPHPPPLVKFLSSVRYSRVGSTCADVFDELQPTAFSRVLNRRPAISRLVTLTPDLLTFLAF